MENSSRNKKNRTVVLMCNRNNDKHTDEDGWTTIETNSNRKSKKTNNNKTLIEATIYNTKVDKKNVKKGDTEEKIELLIRGNRYTLTEEINTQEEGETKTEETDKKNKNKR
jgi:hypothetical protein